MAGALKNYMWFPVLLALTYNIYFDDTYREIVKKAITGDLSGAYQLYLNDGKGNDAGVSSDPDERVVEKSGVKLFTPEELVRFRDLENGLYLAILGKVFDVSDGKKHYGPGGAYEAVTGKDASMAFVTGEFSEDGLTDDIANVTNSQAKSINDWITFYQNKYIFKGKLVGRYYDQDGNPTAAYYQFEEKLRIAQEDESNEERVKKMFPPCNIEWNPETGTRVWCTKRSGGISREWIGVPRQFYEKPTILQNRCACINLDSEEYKQNMGNFREYENCAVESSSCYMKT